jgi:hypothetical protein
MESQTEKIDKIEKEEQKAASEQPKEENVIEETEKNSDEKNSQQEMKEKRKNKMIGFGLIALGIVAAIGFYYFQKNGQAGISLDSAKKTMEEFVGGSLVAPGTEVTVNNMVPVKGFKADLAVGSQNITAFITDDGKMFFPQGVDIESYKAAAEEENAAQPTAEVPKTDKPAVDLFVMSYCPYGTQIEKGIIPVVKALGSSVTFRLRFIDYAMHDKKELDENLRQYCIQKQQPTALLSYLDCFLKKGLGTEAACMAEAKVQAAAIDTCMKQADTQFKVTELYNDKSTWSGGQFPQFNVDKEDVTKYQAKGSPTMVINGVQAASSGRDAASLLKTICSAFNTEPAACKTELSAASPSPGFGTAASASNGGGSCGE